MTNKKLLILLLILICVVCVVFLTACGHEHEYTSQITQEPTCVETGTTTYTCECGDTYTEEIPATGVHTVENGRCSECRIEESSTGLEFSLNEDGKSYTLVGTGSCTGRYIVIGLFNNKPVTSIAQNALENYFHSDGINLILYNCVKKIGSHAFGYNKIEKVSFYGTIDEWATIAFENSYSNPLSTSYSTGSYISSPAFYINDSFITEVTITTATKINDYAFTNYTRLTNVNFGDSVIEIGNAAFSRCTNLTFVSISKNITKIGRNAFRECAKLTNIEVDRNNSQYCSIDGNLYDKNATTLFQYAVGKTKTSFIVPTTVTTIGADAFNNNNSLISVILPVGIENIETQAFYKNTSLTSINFPNTLKNIGFGAFQNCSNLENIDFSSGLESIGDWSFNGCQNVTSIEIPSTVKAIGEYAFNNCTALTSITIGEGVTKIEQHAFKNCANTAFYCKAKSLPSDWDSNWNSDNKIVVWDCDNNEVADDGYIHTIIDGVHYGIKNGEATVLQQKTTVADLTIPSSITYKDQTYMVTEISEKAFYNCTTLRYITLPENLKFIGSYAFYGCSSLYRTTIPANVEKIGIYAFSECNELAILRFASPKTWYATQDLTEWENKSGGKSFTLDGNEYMQFTWGRDDYYWYKK